MFMNNSKRRNRGKREKKVVQLEKRDNRFLLRGDLDLINDLLERGFGTRIGEGLILDPIEVAYLVSRKNKVIVNGKEISEEDALKLVPNFFRFIVYCDLRKRGYFVKPAEAEAPLDLLMWEKGKKVTECPPRYGVKIVTEGLGVKVVDLAHTLKYCESMGLQLVLALISNDGVVTYYKAFSMKLNKLL